MCTFLIKAYHKAYALKIIHLTLNPQALNQLFTPSNIQGQGLSKWPNLIYLRYVSTDFKQVGVKWKVELYWSDNKNGDNNLCQPITSYIQNDD